MTNLLVVIIVLETLLGIATTPRTINYAVEDTPLLGVGSSDQTYTLNSVLPVRTASLLDAATAGTNQPPRDYQPPRRWRRTNLRDYQPSSETRQRLELPTSETTNLLDAPTAGATNLRETTNLLDAATAGDYQPPRLPTSETTNDRECKGRSKSCSRHCRYTSRFVRLLLSPSPP